MKTIFHRWWNQTIYNDEIKQHTRMMKYSIFFKLTQNIIQLSFKIRYLRYKCTYWFNFWDKWISRLDYSYLVLILFFMHSHLIYIMIYICHVCNEHIHVSLLLFIFSKNISYLANIQDMQVTSNPNTQYHTIFIHSNVEAKIKILYVCPNATYTEKNLPTQILLLTFFFRNYLFLSPDFVCVSANCIQC